MARSYMVKDILDDIEFEILQGTIASQEIKKGLEDVRAYQNKARGEALARLKLTDPQREVFSRQFQIIDMLLNLMMELALTVQSTQADARRIGLALPTRQETGSDRGANNLGDASRATVNPMAAEIVSSLEFKPAAELESIMQPDTLAFEPQMQSIRIPVIGPLFTKLRLFYQRPALHFTRLLAHRQSEANRILSERLLFLEAVVEAQQAQIEKLQIDNQK